MRSERRRVMANLREKYGCDIRSGVLKNLITPMQQMGGRCKFYMTVAGKGCSVEVAPDGVFEIHIPNEGDGEVIRGRVVVEVDS